MFSQASNFNAGVDNTFMFIIGISLFFLIGITTTMIVFAIKYNRKRHPIAVQIKERLWVEITWIVIPLILVLFMFYYGYNAFMPERNIPKDAMLIKVQGKMWDWTFNYGNGKFKKDTLVVPVNTAVRLDMNSSDVNHSFYIPAFRIKEDLIPGLTTHMWFIAKEKGIYDILCAEFCGLRHSYMEGRVKVVDSDEYYTWLASIKVEDPNAMPEGLALIKSNGCTGCHSLDGSKLVGPSFKGLFGSKRVVITNGIERTVVADSSYIKKSILNPNNDVVKDFSKGVMQSYNSKLKNSDISKVVNYLSKLNASK